MEWGRPRAVVVEGRGARPPTSGGGAISRQVWGSGPAGGGGGGGGGGDGSSSGSGRYEALAKLRSSRMPRSIAAPMWLHLREAPTLTAQEQVAGSAQGKEG